MTRLGVLLSLLVLALALLSLVLGPAQIGPWEGLRALFAGGDGPVPLVMREVRLPRMILAAVIGGSLGLAGAAMQGYLRNPLAEPGLVGISGTAALGAVLTIHTGLSALWPLALPMGALTGAVVAVALVMTLAGPRGGSLTLILAGIAISAMASALTALVLNLSPNPYAANEIVFWMMGSLADRSMLHVWLALPLSLLGWAMILPLGRGLDALTLGEDAAGSLGVRLVRLRWLLVLGTACVVGAGTAVAGSIGFIGLVVPHLLRPLVGARPSVLLWTSALGGAAMLLAADIAVRVVLPDRDLKLGVITALVGAPLFLHLIYRMRKEGM